MKTNESLLSVEPYSITWYINVCRKSKYSKFSYSIGICEYTGKVAFATLEVLKPLIVRNVYVTDEFGCEDGKYCINTNCDKNKIDVSYSEKYFGLKTMEEIEYVYTWLQKMADDIDAKSLDHNVQTVFKKAPFFIKKNKPKKEFVVVPKE